MSTITERVAAGAAWLDENFLNWLHLVDLNTLRLSSPCRCVLGQLYGDFCDRPEGLFATAYDHGFDTLVGYGTDAEYAALEDEWRRVITERRAAG